MRDGQKPGPGGWNRIEFVVDDIGAEVERLRDAGVRFRKRHRRWPGREAVRRDLRGSSGLVGGFEVLQGCHLPLPTAVLMHEREELVATRGGL